MKRIFLLLLFVGMMLFSAADASAYRSGTGGSDAPPGTYSYGFSGGFPWWELKNIDTTLPQIPLQYRWGGNRRDRLRNIDLVRRVGGEMMDPCAQNSRINCVLWENTRNFSENWYEMRDRLWPGCDTGEASCSGLTEGRTVVWNVRVWRERITEGGDNGQWDLVFERKVGGKPSNTSANSGGDKTDPPESWMKKNGFPYDSRGLTTKIWYQGGNKSSEYLYPNTGREGGPLTVFPNNPEQCQTRWKTRENGRKKDYRIVVKRTDGPRDVEFTPARISIVQGANEQYKKVTFGGKSYVAARSGLVDGKEKWSLLYSKSTGKREKISYIAQKVKKSASNAKHRDIEKQSERFCYWEGSQLGSESFKWSRHAPLIAKSWKRNWHKDPSNENLPNDEFGPSLEGIPPTVAFASLEDAQKYKKNEPSKQIKIVRNGGGALGAGLKESIGLSWKIPKGRDNSSSLGIRIIGPPGPMYAVHITRLDRGEKILPLRGVANNKNNYIRNVYWVGWQGNKKDRKSPDQYFRVFSLNPLEASPTQVPVKPSTRCPVGSENTGSTITDTVTLDPVSASTRRGGINIPSGSNEIVKTNCYFLERTPLANSSIRVVKEVGAGSSTTEKFDFTVSYKKAVWDSRQKKNVKENATQTFELSDGEPRTINNVYPASSFTVTEKSESGWKIDEAFCGRDQSSGNKVTSFVKRGELANCMFVNTAVEAPELCPSDQLGVYPDCYDPPECPPEQIGTYPDCYDPPDITDPTGPGPSEDSEPSAAGPSSVVADLLVPSKTITRKTEQIKVALSSSAEDGKTYIVPKKVTISHATPQRVYCSDGEGLQNYVSYSENEGVFVKPLGAFWGKIPGCLENQIELDIDRQVIRSAEPQEIASLGVTWLKPTLLKQCPESGYKEGAQAPVNRISPESCNEDTLNVWDDKIGGEVTYDSYSLLPKTEDKDPAVGEIRETIKGPPDTPVYPFELSQKSSLSEDCKENGLIEDGEETCVIEGYNTRAQFSSSLQVEDKSIQKITARLRSLESPLPMRELGDAENEADQAEYEIQADLYLSRNSITGNFEVHFCQDGYPESVSGQDVQFQEGTPLADPECGGYVFAWTPYGDECVAEASANLLPPRLGDPVTTWITGDVPSEKLEETRAWLLENVGIYKNEEGEELPAPYIGSVPDQGECSEGEARSGYWSPVDLSSGKVPEAYIQDLPLEIASLGKLAQPGFGKNRQGYPIDIEEYGNSWYIEYLKVPEETPWEMNLNYTGDANLVWKIKRGKVALNPSPIQVLSTQNTR